MNDERRIARHIATDLEAAIDATSLADVLEALAGICHEKAEHLRSNWQDARMAREWERKARYVEQAARKTV